MTAQDIHQLMKRDLALFIEEIERFPEDKLFDTPDGIANSGGNLGLHLAGNISHYIGTGLGQSGYVRDRDREFAAKDVPRQVICEELYEAAHVMDETLSRLRDDQLKESFPDLKPWGGMSIGFVLGQLLAHLNYHRGQLNYLRRIFAATKDVG